MSDDLAAIVRKSDVDDAIDHLNEVNKYDGCRGIAQFDEEHVALPIREAVDHPLIQEVKRGVAGEKRARTLSDHLHERGWSPQEIDQVPASYARIGDLIVFNEPVDHRPKEVAQVLFEIHGEAKAVLEQRSIQGAHRRPHIRHLAGDETSHTIHREHGIIYELDLGDVMFSPGNQHERRRMGEVVDRGERVVDLFAGIGYFTLPMAVNGAYVTAIEDNPVSFRWLTRNLTHNEVDTRVTPIRGDCRMTSVTGERVVVGYLGAHDARDERPSSDGYLSAAVDAIEDSGTLHVHAIGWTGQRGRAADTLHERLSTLDVTVEGLTGHRVKSIAARTEHLVFDVDIARTEP